jgi:hypothetical protein
MVKKGSVNRPVRPAMKKVQQPVQPSFADMKNLLGQMKGMLTWMAKERAALQELVGKLNTEFAKADANGRQEPQPSAEGPAQGQEAQLAPEGPSPAAPEDGAATSPEGERHEADADAGEHHHMPYAPYERDDD